MGDTGACLHGWVCVPKLSRSALGEDCRLERRCTSEMPPVAEALTLSTSVEQKGGWNFIFPTCKCSSPKEAVFLV